MRDDRVIAQSVKEKTVTNMGVAHGDNHKKNNTVMHPKNINSKDNNLSNNDNREKKLSNNKENKENLLPPSCTIKKGKEEKNKTQENESSKVDENVIKAEDKEENHISDEESEQDNTSSEDKELKEKNVQQTVYNIPVTEISEVEFQLSKLEIKEPTSNDADKDVKQVKEKEIKEKDEKGELTERRPMRNHGERHNFTPYAVSSHVLQSGGGIVAEAQALDNLSYDGYSQQTGAYNYDTGNDQGYPFNQVVASSPPEYDGSCLPELINMFGDNLFTDLEQLDVVIPSTISELSTSPEAVFQQSDNETILQHSLFPNCGSSISSPQSDNIVPPADLEQSSYPNYIELPSNSISMDKNSQSFSNCFGTIFPKPDIAISPPDPIFVTIGRSTNSISSESSSAPSTPSSDFSSITSPDSSPRRTSDLDEELMIALQTHTTNINQIPVCTMVPTSVKPYQVQTPLQPSSIVPVTQKVPHLPTPHMFIPSTNVNQQVTNRVWTITSAPNPSNTGSRPRESQNQQGSRGIVPLDMPDPELISAKQRIQTKLNRTQKDIALVTLSNLSDEKLTKADNQGDTQLMILIVNHNQPWKMEYLYEMVNRLKKIPGALQAKNNQQQSALLLACMFMNHEPLAARLIAEALQEQGAPINEVYTKGNTLLHYLCSWGDEYLEVLNELLSMRDGQGRPCFDVNQHNHKEGTPLHVAVKKHSKDLNCSRTAAYLLRNGANVLEKERCSGHTALHIAVKESCEPHLVKILLQAAENHGVRLVNVTDYPGDMALHHAALRNDISESQQVTVIKLLMDYGAMSNQVGSQGRMPLALISSERKCRIQGIIRRR